MSDKIKLLRKLVTEIERLNAELADCKESDRLIERLQARVEELEGDLNIMRLQRNAKHCSRCPECAKEFVYSYGTSTVVIEQGDSCEHQWVDCPKCGLIRRAATEQETE